MRINIRLILLAAGVLLVNQSVFPTKTYKAPVKALQTCTDYVWFADNDFDDPTGTISDVGPEITRLQQLFSGYTFSPWPDGNLHAFEYGWNPGMPGATIYSDL